MRVHCIVNPVAGGGTTAKKWPLIWEDLQKTGFDITYEFTASGNGISLAKAAVQNKGAKLVIAVGGDGTISQVVNGIIGSEAILGIIPTGTGNDFARAVNIPLNSREAAIIIGSLHTRDVDVARIHGQYFINIAGIGFDAHVAALVNSGGNKLLKGQLAYLWALLKTVFAFKPLEVQITSQDGTTASCKILTMAMANARFYGGGMEIAPCAKVDDGQLDLVVIEAMSKVELLISLPMLLRGTHLNHTKVSVYKGRSFSISGQDTYIHADGELISGLPVEVGIVPSAIKLIVP